MPMQPLRDGGGAVARAAVKDAKCLVDFQPPQPRPLAIADGVPLRNRADFNKAEAEPRHQADRARILVKSGGKPDRARKRDAGDRGVQARVVRAETTLYHIEETQALNRHA